MTVDEIRKCIVAAGDVKYTGLKIAPLKEITVADRVKTVAQSLEILETANSSIK
jgi:predicted MarR family transcription regulator